VCTARSQTTREPANHRSPAAEWLLDNYFRRYRHGCADVRRDLPASFFKRLPNVSR
jgi:hypothetical protein